MNTFLMHVAHCCPSAAYGVIFSLFTPHLPSVTINNTSFVVWAVCYSKFLLPIIYSSSLPSFPFFALSCPFLPMAPVNLQDIITHLLRWVWNLNVLIHFSVNQEISYLTGPVLYIPPFKLKQEVLHCTGTHWRKWRSEDG